MSKLEGYNMEDLYSSHNCNNVSKNECIPPKHGFVIYLRTFVCSIINKIINLLLYFQSMSFLKNKDSIMETSEIPNTEYDDSSSSHSIVMEEERIESSEEGDFDSVTSEIDAVFYDAYDTMEELENLDAIDENQKYNIASLSQILMKFKNDTEEIQEYQKTLLYSSRDIEVPDDILNPKSLNLSIDESNDSNASNKFIEKYREYEAKYNNFKSYLDDLRTMLNESANQNVCKIIQELKISKSAENSHKTLETYIETNIDICKTGRNMLDERLTQKEMYKLHRSYSHNISIQVKEKNALEQDLIMYSPVLFGLINGMLCNKSAAFTSILLTIAGFGRLDEISSEQTPALIYILERLADLKLPNNTVAHIFYLVDRIPYIFDDVTKTMDSYIKAKSLLDESSKRARDALNTINSSEKKMQELQNNLQRYQYKRDSLFTE